MLISYSHRFIFFHTGKTGGMSMREILQGYAQDPEKFKIKRPPPLVDDKPNPMFNVWQTLLLHAKAGDAQQELPGAVFDEFFKFAFVRNPWDLQVSMYHFILREPTSSTHQQVAACGSFDAYLEWVVNTAQPYPKGITKLQQDMLTDADGRLLVDFVGRYETLHQDFERIRQKLDIDAVLPHLNRSQHRDYRSYYTPYTQKLVAEHFHRDIELFGYTFDGCLPAP
ncbi:MAG: sulfotransferase [Methylococcaceae bacterium]|nr:MAG: sulfotransferase [Methylococcaceae bacterium]